MNIAVINIRDLFKYILKFCLVFFLIIFLLIILNKNSILNKDIEIKKEIENNAKGINKNSMTFCLDLSISLMSYKKTQNEKENLFTNNKIIAMGTSILDEKIIEKTDVTDLVIDKQVLTTDNIEELTSEVIEQPDEINIENVSDNNIIPNVTDTYKSVKIDNQSDYDITESILVPDVEITNKNDIVIYHTHTCESYTPSKRI